MDSENNEKIENLQKQIDNLNREIVRIKSLKDDKLKKEVQSLIKNEMDNRDRKRMMHLR